MSDVVTAHILPGGSYRKGQEFILSEENLMFISFNDVNGNNITLSREALWGVTLPAESQEPDAPEVAGEILIAGALKSVKVTRDTAIKIRNSFTPNYIS